MRISTKGEYGLRALIELTHHFGEVRPVQSSEIASRQKIPESYLEQLLTILRKSGFIRSVRGPQGGHALIREPGLLRVTEVIEALEGSIMPSRLPRRSEAPAPATAAALRARCGETSAMLFSACSITQRSPIWRSVTARSSRPARGT